MNKQELVKRLTENHDAFIACIEKLSAEEFTYSANEKWTAGQQLEHIYISVKPVNLAFRLPTFLLKFVWGKANRQSRSYDDLTQKYNGKLATGSKATGPYIPKNVAPENGQKLMSQLKNVVERLCLSVEKFSEEDLDYYILPHPLLGKLTLREMIYFTIYHVKHHEKLVVNQLSRRDKK